MSTEIMNTEPLCWIEDKLGNRYYKECESKFLANARRNRDDIVVGDLRKLDNEGRLVLVPGDEAMTDYSIHRYGVADTVDRFIHFSLPKYPKWIQNRFKVAMMNIDRAKKKALTYEGIIQAIKRWNSEEKYFDPDAPIDPKKDIPDLPLHE